MSSGNKMRLYILGIFMLMSLFSCTPDQHGEFALFLVEGNPPANAVRGMELNSLPLASNPLISTDDIQSYDQLTHEIVLTSSGYQRILDLYSLPIDVDGIPFVVTVGSERVYAGAFYTPASSLSFDGVTILQPFSETDPTIQISLGYPTTDAFSGQDPRADSRILESLDFFGKLK